MISLGVYITYSTLDFPNLGVHGTFLLGAAVTAVLLTKGVNAWLTLPITLLVGALAGCVVCHEQRSFAATMGTGQLVYGLAAIIIGIYVMNFYTSSPLSRGLRNVWTLRWLFTPAGATAVILSSILYKLCIQVALSMGMPANMMKLITAMLFLLVLSGRKGEENIRA